MSGLSISRLVGFAGLIAFLVVGFTPLANVLADVMEAGEQLRPAGAIVVLGHGISPGGVLSDGSLRRAVHGIALYRSGHAPLLVMSGAAHPGGPAEAEVRARFATDLGTPREAILTVPDVRTTGEEAERVAALLRPQGVQSILLVTDPLHMRRALVAFERHGFEVGAAPTRRSRSVDTPGARLNLMRVVAQEFLARIYYGM